MDNSRRELIRFAVWEFFTITVALFSAIFQAWGFFAAFSLLSILTPLWLTAVSVVCIAAIKEGQDNER